MFSEASYIIFAFAVLGISLASSGDRLPEFQDCVAQCISNTCPRDLGLLRLLAWDCESDCDYVCQQALTNNFEANDMRLHQFHGKWPFRRLFGMQEIASVVFSLMNLLPNYTGYQALKRLPEAEGFHMKKYYLAFSIVGINTWLWSSVFHVRDLLVTERLDYFSAIGQVLFGLYVASVRLWRLDLPTKRFKRKLISFVLVGFYILHVSYLTFVRFSYAYNMLVGVVVGISQTLLWIYLGVKLFARTHNMMDLLPVALVLSVMAGMSLELNDFSPYWRIFDAHSLWHASTVLPTWFWHKWMQHDLKRQDKLNSIRKEHNRPLW